MISVNYRPVKFAALFMLLTYLFFHVFCLTDVIAMLICCYNF